MSSKSASPITRAVIVAAILTLVVSVVRLYGELQGWDQRFFGTEAGGGYTTMEAGEKVKHMSFFGISWLVPIFGFWFGAIMGRAGKGPKSIGKALALMLLAIGVVVGTFVIITKVPSIKPDSKTLEGIQSFVLMSCVGFAVAAVIALAAWPSMWVTNVIYGLLARIPVIAITYVACLRGWDTHHVKLGPDSLQMPDAMEKAFWLSIPQVTFWQVFTILIGGLFATLAAALFKPKAVPPPHG